MRPLEQRPQAPRVLRDTSSSGLDISNFTARGQGLDSLPLLQAHWFPEPVQSPRCPAAARIPVGRSNLAAPAPRSVPAQRPCEPRFRLASPCPSRGRHTAHTRPPGPRGSHLVRRRCWRGARSGCGAGTGGPSVGSGPEGGGAGRGAAPGLTRQKNVRRRAGAGPRQPGLIWPRPTGLGGGVFPGEPPSLRGPSPWWAGGGVGGELGGLDSPGKGVCLGRSFLSSEAAGPPGGPPALRPHPHHSPRARAPAYSPGRASFHQAKYGFFPLPEKSRVRVDLLYSQVPAGVGRPRALGQVTLQVLTCKRGVWW